MTNEEILRQEISACKLRISKQSDEMDELRATIQQLKGREYALLQANDLLSERNKTLKKTIKLAHQVLGIVELSR